MGAEGRDFNHLVLAAPAIDHMDDTKAPSNDEGTAKGRFDLLGRGVGGDVEIFGFQTQQQVTHRTTDDIGFEATVLQGAHDVQSAFVHPIGIDAVHFGGHHLALTQRGLFAGG